MASAINPPEGLLEHAVQAQFANSSSIDPRGDGELRRPGRRSDFQPARPHGFEGLVLAIARPLAERLQAKRQCGTYGVVGKPLRSSRLREPLSWVAYRPSQPGMFLHDSHPAHPATMMTVSRVTIRAVSFIMVTSPITATDLRIAASSLLDDVGNGSFPVGTVDRMIGNLDFRQLRRKVSISSMKRA